VTEHYRADDKSLDALFQRFVDFDARYNRDQDVARTWRTLIERRLEPLERIKAPFHLLSVIIFLLLSGLLFEVGRLIVSAARLVSR
jgi:hypothetical protein